MHVREATLADIGGLVDVHISAWRVAYRGIIPDQVLDNLSPERRRTNWHRALSDPADRTTLVCHAEGCILGFAAFGPSRDADAGPSATAELMALYVHPDHWRRGIGTLLWQETEKRFVGHYRDITLWVLCDNDRARRFYERIGFVPEPDVLKSLPWYGPDLYEVRYRRPLGPGETPIEP